MIFPLQAFARCCAPITASTAAACATAKRAGKAPNATYRKRTAEWPTVPGTVRVKTDCVNVNKGGKETIATKVRTAGFTIE